MHPPPSPGDTFDAFTSILTRSVMCCFRRVRNVYLQCGHVVDIPDEEIKCESPNCKFSPVHPPDCLPPTCKQTCWQYTLNNTRHKSTHYAHTAREHNILAAWTWFLLLLVTLVYVSWVASCFNENYPWK